jgi:dienelactone hydrolase
MPDSAMRLLLLIIAVLTIVVPIAGNAEPVSFSAADGVQIFADYYPAESKSKPLILLFHQAGSNRGEYAPIAPMLAALGFNALALDQRSGGALFGRDNETVRKLGRSTGFGEVIRDMEAALHWSRDNGHTGPVIVWGSSYSAALVLLFAARHPQDVAAVLAFSPGEYLGGSDTVGHAAAQVAVPVFVTSASTPDEVAAAKVILAASPATLKVQFVPKLAGVHGSSTLRSDRNPKGAAENWAAVRDFLAALHL